MDCQMTAFYLKDISKIEVFLLSVLLRAFIVSLYSFSGHDREGTRWRITGLTDHAHYFWGLQPGAHGLHAIATNVAQHKTANLNLLFSLLVCNLILGSGV